MMDRMMIAVLGRTSRGARYRASGRYGPSRSRSRPAPRSRARQRAATIEILAWQWAGRADVGGDIQKCSRAAHSPLNTARRARPSPESPERPRDRGRGPEIREDQRGPDRLKEQDDDPR